MAYAGSKQPKVVRSVFAAELHNQVDSASTLLYWAGFMDEIIHGPQEPSRLAQKITRGGFGIPSVMICDIKGVYDAITAVDTKPPAEKHLTRHVKQNRHQLDERAITYAAWCDTRDMIADGLMKGEMDEKTDQ